MKIWFDTEFIEDGKTVDLISIGMVREDGATLYIESSECDLSRASDWVKENVLPSLTGPSAAARRFRIAQCVREFAGEKPEFWAYYADYDWVALCQLYGTMMDLPKGARFLTSDGDENTPEKAALDQLHFRKIDISDAVFVVNVGGYVGSSTKREIAYAKAAGKAVEWLFGGSNG